jgi:hypothetical protein
MQQKIVATVVPPEGEAYQTELTISEPERQGETDLYTGIGFPPNAFRRKRYVARTKAGGDPASVTWYEL